MRIAQSSDSVRKADRPLPLEPGEPFNPYKLFTGVFIPEALVRTRQVSAGAKLAYGRLSRYAGEDGDCHPSVKALARELGFKERQAQRYLAELQASGLIRSFPRFKAPNVRDTNGYVFLWHQIFAGSLRPPVSNLTPPPVSTTTPPPVSDVAPKENQIEESHLEESPSSSSVIEERNGSQSSLYPDLGTEKAGKGEQATTTNPVPEKAEQHPKPEKHTSALAPTPFAQPSTPANGSPRKHRSDRDELVALIARSVGQMPDNRLVWDIQRYIEIRGGSLHEYVDDIQPRLERLRKRPMFGFFLWHAQNWNSSGSREVAPPSTVQDQAANQQCSCKAGRLAEGYCTCAMGKDLSRVENRLAREIAAEASAMVTGRR